MPDEPLPEITDDSMRESLAKSRAYSLLILRAARELTADEKKIVWEHGRRNFALRAKGLMPIVCPVTDDSGIAGIAILDMDVEEAKRIISGDPGVQAGIFTYEIHPCRGFPGSGLP